MGKSVVQAKADGIEWVSACCGVCGSAEAEKVGEGYDFEYFTTLKECQAFRCKDCLNIFLNPRPDENCLALIYPSTYHSLDFSEGKFSFVFRIRSKLEAGRLLRYCHGLPDDAKILDVGCGDGFHLALLREFGPSTWTLEGADLDGRAVKSARRKGFRVHHGTIEKAPLKQQSYNAIYLIQTIEHVADPVRVFASVFKLLKPGGRLIVVTDNTSTVDFHIFGQRHWGGYHFPRHWNLLNKGSLRALAEKSGFRVESIDTIVSPVNWVYSIRNYLTDKRYPTWMIERFSLKSPISLGVFTLLDIALGVVGRGALLNGVFVRPEQAAN